MHPAPRCGHDSRGCDGSGAARTSCSRLRAVPLSARRSATATAPSTPTAPTATTARPASCVAKQEPATSAWQQRVRQRLLHRRCVLRERLHRPVRSVRRRRRPRSVRAGHRRPARDARRLRHRRLDCGGTCAGVNPDACFYPPTRRPAASLPARPAWRRSSPSATAPAPALPSSSRTAGTSPAAPPTAPVTARTTPTARRQLLSGPCACRSSSAATHAASRTSARPATASTACAATRPARVSASLRRRGQRRAPAPR